MSPLGEALLRERLEFFLEASLDSSRLGFISMFSVVVDVFWPSASGRVGFD